MFCTLNLRAEVRARPVNEWSNGRRNATNFALQVETFNPSIGFIALGNSY
jgi:hypothetical protein